MRILKQHIDPLPGKGIACPGTPVSVGEDAQGQLCVWFREDSIVTDVMPLFTGDTFDTEARDRYLGMVVTPPLVWHFVARRRSP